MRESERVHVFLFLKTSDVDGFKYHNFVYYINKLDRETADHYDLDYLGSKYLKAEER